MKKQRGRPIMAAVFGFFAGLFGAIALLAFGVIPLESIWVTIIPLATLVLAFSLAMWAPIGRAKPPAPATESAPPAPEEAPPPAPEEEPPPAPDDTPPSAAV